VTNLLTAAAGDRGRFTSVLGSSGLSIATLTTLAAIVLYLVAGPAIEVLLGGGEFDADDVAITTLLLGAFAMSIPLESLTQLFARAIYATKNTILPVIASVAGLAVTVVAVAALTDGLGVVALPAGYAIGMAAKLALLTLALPSRIRTI